MKAYEKLASESEAEFTGIDFENVSFEYLHGYHAGFIMARTLAYEIAALQCDSRVVKSILHLGEKEV